MYLQIFATADQIPRAIEGEHVGSRSLPEPLRAESVFDPVSDLLVLGSGDPGFVALRHRLVREVRIRQQAHAHKQTGVSPMLEHHLLLLLLPDARHS